jgi:hypothetical protein
MLRRRGRLAYSASARRYGTPNLLERNPVEMYGVGLRVDVGIDPERRPAARTFSREAMAATRSSSSSDSRLRHRMRARSACSISDCDFPDPGEDRPLCTSPPAARTRASSPPETMSKPRPSRESSASTARLEFALTE